MKTVLLGLGMILASSVASAAGPARTGGRTGELVPATRSAMPAPAARKILNNATDRVDTKDVKSFESRVGTNGVGTVGATEGAVSERVDGSRELTQAERLQVRASVTADHPADTSSLAVSRKAVLKNFLSLSKMVVRDQGALEGYAGFLDAEVTKWDCAACVEGFNGVQNRMTEIAKVEVARGSEITLQRSFEVAMTEAGKMEKFKDNCPRFF